MVPLSQRAEVVGRPPARWAVWCAYAVPWMILPTALWRLPIAFGFAMGMVDPSAPPWAWWAVPYTLGLIVLIEVLAVLTVGLVAPWGEAVPRWLPWVGGVRVNPRVVTAAAVIGGLALSVLWISDLIRWLLGDRVEFRSGWWETIALVALLTHVAWGPLLLAVTVDYWRRHREG
ncbi:hypothetical protein [Kribbella albertanoniae]|nr:hypothetical protein [Kribbella albertanoniae]